MKSLIGRPKIAIAGESFVSGSGVLRYWSMATLNASVLSSPLGDVLDVIIRLTVFTPISAPQFECGNATKDLRWWMPQSRRNFRVCEAMNSGPPSLDSSSGMPNVMNVRFNKSTNPVDPSNDRSTISQLE